MVALDTFPVSIKVAGRRIVVIGGGPDALNKTRLGLRTSATVEVWARDFAAGFLDLPQDRLILNQRRRGLDPLSVGPNWLAGAALVFIAEGGEDGAFAESEARVAGVLVNVVDHPKSCDFYTPSIVDRAPVSIAVMTEGAAPVIGRQVRAAVEAALPPHLGALVELAGSLRDEVAGRLQEGSRRRHFYERLAESQAVAAALEQGPEAARAAGRDLLDRAVSGAEPGAVAWVGAGPGAEDLLTLRAQRLLQAADIIVADADVPAILIDMGRRDAERHIVDDGDSFAGRTRIAALLVGLAEKGGRVVRLTLGDPRRTEGLAEEIAVVRRAGLFVTLVPGIAADETTCATEPAFLPDRFQVA